MTRFADNVRDRFELKDRVAVITGGAGLLGMRHAEAIAEMGGNPVLVDIDDDRLQSCAKELTKNFQCDAIGLRADISSPQNVTGVLKNVLDKFGRVDILI